jgi:DNA-repair protein complementing XP-A cells
MENSETKPILSDKQKARIERNRQRAILLRNARLSSHPYTSKSTNNSERSESSSGVTSTNRTLDTGGGFLLDIEDQIEAEKELNVVFEPGVLECNKVISLLWTRYINLE